MATTTTFVDSEDKPMIVGKTYRIWNEEFGPSHVTRATYLGARRINGHVSAQFRKGARGMFVLWSSTAESSRAVHKIETHLNVVAVRTAPKRRARQTTKTSKRSAITYDKTVHLQIWRLKMKGAYDQHGRYFGVGAPVFEVFADLDNVRLPERGLLRAKDMPTAKNIVRTWFPTSKVIFRPRYKLV